MGSVIKKRRKRMAKKKHRKLLRKTRVQRRRLGKQVRLALHADEDCGIAGLVEARKRPAY